MIGGVMSPGEKVVRREIAFRRHPGALTTFIAHYPHLRFLFRLFHAHHEDDGTREQRRWRCDTTGFRTVEQ